MTRRYRVSDPILTNLSYATLHIIGTRGLRGDIAFAIAKMANGLSYKIFGEPIEPNKSILPEVMKRLRG